MNADDLKASMARVEAERDRDERRALRRDVEQLKVQLLTLEIAVQKLLRLVQGPP